MAQDLQVTCINKTDRFNPHERIRYIGGTLQGARWKLSQEQAIADIKSGAHSFWVNRGGNRVQVVVAISSLGNEYLKTESDGEQPNNLLSLPECP